MTMSKIKWIHFSDLHLNVTDTETNLLREQLKSYLAEKEIKCDYAFCSGDLRNAPDKVFPEDSVQQLKNICEVVGVPLERFFIVPGNHDIDREIPERINAVERVLNNYAKKGYYDSIRGQIRKEDLEAIKTGETEFVDVMLKLYQKIPLRAEEYNNLSHFVVITEDFNIVHLDSTLTYTKGQEDNLVIGTKLLYDILDKTDPQKYTIILSHYPFDLLKPGEKNQVCQVLQQYKVQLWLSGHSHDVLLQKQRDLFYEFQCGSFVWDGGKNTVLIGEIDTETGSGQVQGYIWQRGDGWIKNEYINKTSPDNKAVFPFRLRPNDSMMMAHQGSLVNTDNVSEELVEKAIEKIRLIYDDRYFIREKCKYGLFVYPIIAKGGTPSQVDTIFIIKVLDPLEYNLTMMQNWMKEMSDYLNNYEMSQNCNALVELQLIIPNYSHEDKEQLYQKDFADTLDKSYHKANFHLVLVKEESLIAKDEIPRQSQRVFIESVTIIPTKKEVVDKSQNAIIGKVFAQQPILLEDYPSIRQINLEIRTYYETVWKEWDELLEKHESEFDFARLAELAYQGDITELTLTDGLTYEVLYNQNGLLSMKFERYVYLGGPHGSPIRSCVVYDLNTAAKLKLHEVLPLSFAELMQQIEQSIKIQYTHKDSQLVAECYENIQEKYHDIDEFKFYIGNFGSIYIYFDYYEIGCYAMGYMDIYLGDFENPEDRKLNIKEQTIIRALPISSSLVGIYETN